MLVLTKEKKLMKIKGNLSVIEKIDNRKKKQIYSIIVSLSVCCAFNAVTYG